VAQRQFENSTPQPPCNGCTQLAARDEDRFARPLLQADARTAAIIFWIDLRIPGGRGGTPKL